jgi:PKD repeat protein
MKGFGQALLSSAAIAAGCGEANTSFDAAPPVDARQLPDGSKSDAEPSLGWVDFALSGCESGAGTEADPCLGTAPLTLRFTVIAPAKVTDQAWDFGDGAPKSRLASPEHTYATPGDYSVTLNVAGPGGTAGAVHLAAVQVSAAPLGASCGDAAHCDSGDCLCPQGTCLGPLSSGMCTASCTSDADCGPDAACVDLDPADDASAPWHRSACLVDCSSSSCSPDRTCQSLLGADGDWKWACFAPGFLREVGAPCKDGNGAPMSSWCASGQCLDVGTRGMCSLGCATSACPDNSECASFASGNPQMLCLAQCSAFACDQDPGLSCQQPSAMTFSLETSPDPQGYCAPE